MIEPVTAPSSRSEVTARDPTIWAAARNLELAFLTEMMKAAGLADPLQSFSGGPGEEQFASFLRQEQVSQMVEAGGIGMAEAIYSAMVARS